MKKDTKYLITTNAKLIKYVTVEVIDVPIYKCSVTIARGKEATKLCKYWNKDLSEYGGETIDYLKEHSEVCIIFPSDKPTIEYVVHELTHATQMILRHIGFRETGDGCDEPFAYLLGYLVKEFYKK
jgi:hypothetical protein